MGFETADNEIHLLKLQSIYARIHACMNAFVKCSTEKHRLYPRDEINYAVELILSALSETTV